MSRGEHTLTPPRRPGKGVVIAGLLALLLQSGEGSVAASPNAQLVPPSTAQASAPIAPIDPRKTRPIKLHHIKTGRTYDLQLFDPEGKVRRQALHELREFLACTRTGEDHPIHWRLVSILHSIGEHWPGHRIEIVSAYRHPKVSRYARRSNHTRGRAIDLRVRGVSNRLLRDTLRRSFSGIGVGYYPNSSFIHLDVRERDSQWIDYAGPGQAPCYSRTPQRDLVNGSAESTRYEDAIARGCRGKQSSLPAPKAKGASPSPKSPAKKNGDDEGEEHDGTRSTVSTQKAPTPAPERW